MGIELIDESKTYEEKYMDGVIFILRHWTLSMQEETDRRCVIIDSKQGKVANYDISLERELKLKNSLVDWKGVSLNGKEVPCTIENRKKLPVGIMLWIVQKIDERAGLRITEDEKKN